METFYKIDNLHHHGLPVYYLLTEKDTKLIKATEFNDKYIYYYQSHYMNEEYTLLGKFIGKENDYDYEVYNFENGLPIYKDKLEFIYCKRKLPPLFPPKENGRNLLLIPNLTYSDSPIYVHLVKET